MNQDGIVQNKSLQKCSPKILIYVRSHFKIILGEDFSLYIVLPSILRNKSVRRTTYIYYRVTVLLKMYTHDELGF